MARFGESGVFLVGVDGWPVSCVWLCNFDVAVALAFRVDCSAWLALDDCGHGDGCRDCIGLNNWPMVRFMGGIGPWG